MAMFSVQEKNGQFRHTCRDCGVEITFKETWKGSMIPVTASTGLIHDCRWVGKYGKRGH